MTDQSSEKRNKPHFYLTNPISGVFEFSPKVPPIRKKLAPKGVRQQQAKKLQTEIETAVKQGLEALGQADPDLVDPRKQGFYLELQLSDALGFIDGLENGTKKISIKNLKVLDPEKGIVSVVVYVPQKNAYHYRLLAERYAAKTDAQKPTPVDEAIARIESVKHASFDELYTDDRHRLPSTSESSWWEIWVDIEFKERAAILFDKAGLEFQERVVTFAESCIFHVKALRAELVAIIKASDVISEIRLPQKPPGYFLSILNPVEQAKWIEDVVKRRTFAPNPKVKICVLDTGVNHKHPLLEGLIPTSHAEAFDPKWGADDKQNHGTPMSSTALYGDIYEHMISGRSVEIGHGLISIKVIPDPAFPANQPKFYGLIIEDSVQRCDVIDGASKKIICYAITHPDEDATGKPSITSSYLDKLSLGSEGLVSRVYVVAAGNIFEDIYHANYDDLNIVSPIYDPAQSWNAISVGAFTEKGAIKTGATGSEKALAPIGALSPRSRTSCSWLGNWPIKPDVVFEGGNMSFTDSAVPCEWHEDLSLIAASASPPNGLFTHMADTSAAAALAAKMCAEIQTTNPSLWPESVRGLLVHSAEWTRVMRQEIFQQLSKKLRVRHHIRKYGHGVPSLERALYSLKNDLTMVIEDSIIPFTAGAAGAKFKEIKLYDLPWPSEALQSIGDADAELKVTLSYFIEPNPGKPIISRKRTYQSYGLQFEIRRPGESESEFKNRVNKLQMIEEGESHAVVMADEPVSEDGDWVVGKRGRNVGSLHSDTWIGTAAGLADRGQICIYPRAGWWKHNKKLKRWDSPIRYSLIVSIRTPSQIVDLYTAVENAIKVQTATEIEV